MATACENNQIAVAIANKTAGVLYIDKAESFIYINGQAQTLFQNSVQTISETESSGSAFNLGGISRAFGINGAVGSIMEATTLGRGSASTSTTTIVEQRIIAIAPYATEVVWLGDIELNSSIIDCGELGGFNNLTPGSDGRFIDPRNGYSEKFRIGAHKSYTADNTPFSFRFAATYSLTNTFEQKQIVSVEHYISDIVIDHHKGVRRSDIYLPYCSSYFNSGRECYKFRTGRDVFGCAVGFVTATVAIAGSAALLVVALV